MFRIEIKGLDKLTRQLKEAERALQELDGEIGTVKFDPTNPTDVQRAIREIERKVDTKLSRFRGNPLVQTVAQGAKKTFREYILKQQRNPKR